MNVWEKIYLEIRNLKLNGIFEIKPILIGDMRGYFAEIYLEKAFSEHGLQTNWVQENQSLSTDLHTLRGLHFQAPPYAQTKLVRAVVGKVLDVFVDVRKKSATYGQWDSIVLSDELCNSVYVSRGFAHGFCTLTDDAIVQYKVDAPYDLKSEGGIIWDDADLAIVWNADNPKLSTRDASMPTFAEFETPFV